MPQPDAARLRVTLLDLEPAPWREFEIPLSITFKGLHDCIQAAFQWWGHHLWEFEVADRRYGPSVDDGFREVRIYKADANRLTRLRDGGVREFLYTYDFGDGWEHRVEILDLFAAGEGADLPRFLAGKWRAPPDDVGGPPGFEMFLEALSDPKHPDHADLLDWHGGPFDAEDIEEEIVRIGFGRLAAARRGKKTGGRGRGVWARTGKPRP